MFVIVRLFGIVIASFVDAAMSDTQQPSSEIQINVKGVLDSSYSQWKLTVHFCCSPRTWYSLGPNDLKLQITTSTDKTVRDLKQAISEKSDVEADRQVDLLWYVPRCRMLMLSSNAVRERSLACSSGVSSGDKTSTLTTCAPMLRRDSATSREKYGCA